MSTSAPRASHPESPSRAVFRRAPFTGALLFSIAAHAAAILFVRVADEAAQRPPPRSIKVAIAATAPGAATDAARSRPIAPSRIDAPRRVASAASKPTREPADIAPPPAPEATSDEAPIEGVGIVADIAPMFGGGARRRWYDSPTAVRPATTAHGFGPQRATLAAQAAEASMIGALFANLTERWRAADVEAGRCEVRRAAESVVADCDATAATTAASTIAETPESQALLERFDCLRFDRGETGARVSPCGAF